MNEKPILFSGPMVKAILEGRKTQTRRVISRIHGHSEWLLTDRRIVGTQEMLSQCTANVAFVLKHCPYGQPGDHLWVRETWRAGREDDGLKPSELDPKQADIWWEADGSSFRRLNGKPGKVRPSIFMPRWASRITLEVTGVRVERVQEIDLDGALAEGCPMDHLHDMVKPERNEHGIPIRPGMIGAVAWFWKLWDSINAKRGYPWASNPWVWVIEFKMTEGKD